MVGWSSFSSMDKAQPEAARNDTQVVDPFEDDTPIEAVCDLENPDYCESCQ